MPNDDPIAETHVHALSPSVSKGSRITLIVQRPSATPVGEVGYSFALVGDDYTEGVLGSSVRIDEPAATLVVDSNATDEMGAGLHQLTELRLRRKGPDGIPGDELARKPPRLARDCMEPTRRACRSGKSLRSSAAN